MPLRRWVRHRFQPSLGDLTLAVAHVFVVHRSLALIHCHRLPILLIRYSGSVLMCRILAVSDSVDPALYDHFNVERWRAEKIELIISCGDLPAYYLSYLVSRFDVPLYYVKGNHDESYREEPPEGGESIDGKLITVDGLRILGLGGAPRYN